MSSDSMEPEPEEPDLSINPVAPGGDKVNADMNLAAFAAMQRIMSTEKITIEWMTGETGNHINMAMHAANTSIQMEMMRQGLTQPQAEGHARQQILLMAFELGRRCGAEMHAAATMKEMFGDDFDLG